IDFFVHSASNTARMLLATKRTSSISGLRLMSRRRFLRLRPIRPPNAAFATHLGSYLSIRFTQRPPKPIGGSSWAVHLTCSPKTDPCVMRVSSARQGKEVLDETEATQSGADHSEASGRRRNVG